VRILIVYRGLPWPIWEGYHLRVLHLFRRLARRHEVHLLGLLHTEEQAAREVDLAREGIFASIRTLWLPRRSPWGRLRTNLGLGPAPAAFHAEYPGFARRLRGVLADLRDRHGLEAGYVFDPWADLLLAEALVLPTLLDVCDRRTLFFRRRAERGDLGFLARLRNAQMRRRYAGYEAFLLRRYPVATVVSPADRQECLRLCPEARVEVIPNGVDLEMFRPLPEVAEIPGRLILFGNMDFLPNADAAVRVARCILPRVRERHPEASFTIVGTRPLPEVRRLAEEVPGVEVTGRVEDLKPWIARACMLVAPMRFGAGIKNKVLESLAMEKPVVTNATGTEALGPEVRRLLVTGESDEELARAVSELLDDSARRRELGRLGREAMARHHSWDAAAARYEALLAELAAQKSA
jgi:glycosyltransferase involved in cell wall biosynthesis